MDHCGGEAGPRGATASIDGFNPDRLDWPSIRVIVKSGKLAFCLNAVGVIGLLGEDCFGGCVNVLASAVILCGTRKNGLLFFRTCIPSGGPGFKISRQQHFSRLFVNDLRGWCVEDHVTVLFDKATTTNKGVWHVVEKRDTQSAPSGVSSKGRGAMAICFMLVLFATPTVMPCVTSVLCLT